MYRGKNKIGGIRVGFLTPEFEAGGSGQGGLGGYVYRISKALQRMGHDPEIFCVGRKTNEVYEFDGIRVEKIQPNSPFVLRNIRRLMKKALKYDFHNTNRNLSIAFGMAKAVEKRDRDNPFNIIQSSDCIVPGLMIKKNRVNRKLVVRCSWARDLCLKADKTPNNLDIKVVSYLERTLIKKADIAYAPSIFVAKHYKKYGLNVKTIRPPFILDAKPANILPFQVPKRYLLHFGVLGLIKGSDILAEALPLVWKEAPNFKMIWAGDFKIWTERGQRLDSEMYPKFQRMWGKNKDKVLWTGPISKSDLYCIIKMADAVVLPSRTDNLPNTAIESLFFGTPVIGPNDASFDEIIEPGVCGEFFERENIDSLAEVLIKVWRSDYNWLGSGFRKPAIFNEMNPEFAAKKLIELCS